MGCRAAKGKDAKFGKDSEYFFVDGFIGHRDSLFVTIYHK
jgi:hypothetical protein